MIYSKKIEILKAMFTSERMLSGEFEWARLSPAAKERYQRLFKIVVEELRNPTNAQLDRALKRSPSTPKSIIRQAWKDMIDEILESK